MPDRGVRGVGLEFARFVLVGVGNTLVSFVVYDMLLTLAVPYPAAAAAAFAAGAVNGYLLNRRWTFHADDSTRGRLRYAVVQGCGLGLTTGLLSLLVHGERLGEVAGYAATLPLVTTATFLANRTWVFRAGRAGARGASRRTSRVRSRPLSPSPRSPAGRPG